MTSRGPLARVPARTSSEKDSGSTTRSATRARSTRSRATTSRTTTKSATERRTAAAARPGPSRSGAAKASTARSSAPRPGAAKASTAKASTAKSGAAKSPKQNRGHGPLEIVVHYRRRLSTRGVVVLSALAFFAILFLAVSVQAMRAQGDRNLDAINQGIRVETERYLELRAKLAEKESPARIMGKARTMGMIDPGPVAPLASPAGEGADEEPGPT
ncbi:MAG: hypothetical protein V9F03_11945 [Microthrixaceae bacterium]